ncbi:hypothetical protein ALC57_12352, partial [Trachymyrmex cornetzi]
KSRQETSHDVARSRCWINIKDIRQKFHVVKYVRRRAWSVRDRARRAVTETAHTTRSHMIRLDNGTGSIPVPNDQLPVSVVHPLIAEA